MLLLTLIFSYVPPLNIKPWPLLIYVYRCNDDHIRNGFFQLVFFFKFILFTNRLMCRVCTIQSNTAVLVPPLLLACLAM